MWQPRAPRTIVCTRPHLPTHHHTSPHITTHHHTSPHIIPPLPHPAPSAPLPRTYHRSPPIGAAGSPPVVACAAACRAAAASGVVGRSEFGGRSAEEFGSPRMWIQDAKMRVAHQEPTGIDEEAFNSPLAGMRDSATIVLSRCVLYSTYLLCLLCLPHLPGLLTSYTHILRLLYLLAIFAILRPDPIAASLVLLEKRWLGSQGSRAPPRPGMLTTCSPG